MDATSISYFLAYPTSVRLSFSRPSLLLVAALVPWFLVWNPWRGSRAAALRVGAFLAVVAVLAGIRLAAPLPENRLALVAAVDVSESVGEPARQWSQKLLNEIARAMAPGDEMAILTFANDTRLARPLSGAAPVSDLAVPSALTATDLARAIDSAVTLYPSDGERRLLLITDGNETRGDSRRTLPLLRADGIRVDVAIPPADDRPDVQVDKLVTPPMISDEGILPLRVVAHNYGKPRNGVLNLFLDGLMIDSMAVELQSGLNRFELSSRIAGQGSHLLRAQLEVPDDRMPGNNYQEVYVTVHGLTRVLVATPSKTSPLADALENKGFAVDTVAPETIPSIDGLLRYHAVVLEDLRADRIVSTALEEIERYVGDFGGGLILAAGGATFGDARLVDSPLARILPLTLEPHRPKPEAREPLALFLLIDRSNSMGYNSRLGTLRDGEKLRYAKEAGLAVVQQLKDQDLVGVIAFDSQPHEISSLKPLRQNRQDLEELLPRLVENGGTDFYDALESAREQLAASRVSRRHVVLLTDGDTNRSAFDEYDALLARMVDDKISVTTIRIGDNTINLELLQQISGQSGGVFHHVKDAQALPDLMLKDTTRALGPPPKEPERFFPQLGTRSQVTSGIRERGMPPLLGYAFAKAKGGADVPLHVTRLERRDPLLATWQFGLGRVAAFAASPSGDAKPWLAWPEYSKFWSQLVRWTARAHTGDEYAVDVRKSGGSTYFTVRGFDAGTEAAVLLARLQLNPEDAREISLVPNEPRQWNGVLGETPGGRFPLTLICRIGDHVVSERTLLVTIPDRDQEPQEEHRVQGPNMSLLTQITEETGGVVNPSAREISKRKSGRGVTFYRLDHILAPLGMLLFLGDVALRRRRGGV